MSDPKHRKALSLKTSAIGPCAICRTIGPLAADHCHVSGYAREPLCRHCNVGLGMFKDDAALLQAAASYVQQHSSAIASLQYQRSQDADHTLALGRPETPLGFRLLPATLAGVRCWSAR